MLAAHRERTEEMSVLVASGFGCMRVRVPPRVGSQPLQESSALRADSVPTLTPCSLASFGRIAAIGLGYGEPTRYRLSQLMNRSRVRIPSAAQAALAQWQSSPILTPMLAPPGHQNTQHDHNRCERADEASVIFRWALENSAPRPRAAFRSSIHARLPNSVASRPPTTPSGASRRDIGYRYGREGCGFESRPRFAAVARIG